MRAEWDEIIELAVRAAARGVRVAVPACVVRVEHAEGRVAVKPELRRPRTNPELPQDEDPVLADVPVLFPSSTAIEIAFQLAPGDRGLVVFADYALGVWLANGELVSPGPGEAHGLSGAVFVPGLWPDGSQVAIPASGLIAGERGGERLEVGSGLVRAGTGAPQRAIRGDEYSAAEQNFLAAEKTFLTALNVWAGVVGAAFPGATATFQAAIVAYVASLNSFDGQLPGTLATVTRVK